MYSLKINDDNADLYLYSAILGSEYGSSTFDVIQELNNFTGELITLHINSEGGDIFEAQGMYTYLKNHQEKVHVYIDGLCASAAGVVALAGDKVFMPENALMMIHNPAGAVYGESEDMRKLADILDKIRDTIAILYEEKTGLTHAKVIDLMKAETWLTAKEAKNLKLVDEIIPALKVKNESQEYQAGVIHERERLRALDEISTLGNLELVNKAKYETYQTANEIALDLLKINARERDAVSVTANARVRETVDDCIKSVSELINKMRGY